MAFFNLVILFLVLRKVLFKPIMEFMDKRTKSIEDSIADAEKQKAEAIELKNTYEAQLKAARVEASGIIDAAITKATAQQENIVTGAKQQAEELLAKAKEQIELEREQMLKDVRSEVASLAFASASRILTANMDNESNRQLVDKFIDEAGAA
jgi:F-type H+-transporting ATPase subunit b